MLKIVHALESLALLLQLVAEYDVQVFSLIRSLLIQMCIRDRTKTGSATFNKMKEVVIPTPTGIFAYCLAPSDWNQVDC